MWEKQFVLDRVEVDAERGCWLWRLSTSKYGYGQLGRFPYTAHALAYRLWKGEPDGLIRHQCPNPRCCNPEHLETGTYKQNYEDSREKHDAANMRRRGKPSHNSQSIEIYGQIFKSKDAARKALKISYSRLLRDCKVLE